MVKNTHCHRIISHELLVVNCLNVKMMVHGFPVAKSKVAISIHKSVLLICLDYCCGRGSRAGYINHWEQLHRNHLLQLLQLLQLLLPVFHRKLCQLVPCS